MSYPNIQNHGLMKNPILNSPFVIRPVDGGGDIGSPDMLFEDGIAMSFENNITMEYED